MSKFQNLNKQLDKSSWRLIAATIVVLLSPSQLFAQTAPAVITPLQVEKDLNGVNLVDGKIEIPTPTLSIPADPNLKFDLVQNAAPYFRANLTTDTQADPGTGSYSIHSGSSASESFTCDTVGQPCVNTTGAGSTFNRQGFLYQKAGSGEIFKFNLVQSYVVNPTSRTRQNYASQVTYPDGEIISYAYNSYQDPGSGSLYLRPVTLTSNLGYVLLISYQSDVFPSNDWSRPKVAAIYATANTNTPLARLTYDNNGGITDLANRTVISGAYNQLGIAPEASSGSVSLPTEAAASTVVTALANAPLIATVTQDGVSWNYAYGNLAFNSTRGRYEYDSFAVTGPNGYQKTYAIGLQSVYGTGVPPQPVITSITDALSQRIAFTYDAQLRPVTSSLPLNNGVNLTYDVFGNITQKVTKAKPGSGLADLSEAAFVDTTNCVGVLCYRPVWYRDALARQTDYIYNVNGQLTEQTDPADATGTRRKTYISYEAHDTGAGIISRKNVVRVCGLGTTCGTSAEIRTEYDYSANTFLPSVERRIDAAAGVTLTTSYAYDAAGRLLSVDGPLAGTDDAIYYRYDVAGRLTFEISAKGANGLRIATRFTYRDSDGKPVTVEIGTLPDAASTTLTVINRTDTTYDSRRNAIRSTFSASGPVYTVTDRSFDDRKQQLCQTQRMNTAAFGATPDACTLGTQGNDGPDRITHNLYDVAGQLLKVQKAYNTSLQQDYATYTYSANGKQVSVTDANGNLALMSYDGFDRLTRWNFPSPTTRGVASTTDYESYGYDAASNRISLTKRDGATLTYQFDGLNHTTVKTVPASASGGAGYVVYTGYDVRGLQTYARFGSPSGEGVTNVYDGFGRVVSATTNTGGNSRLLTYQYDAISDRTRITHPDGIYFNTTFDAAGRMLHGDWIKGAATTPFMDITYDALGRRSNITRGSSYTAYGYDGSSRLTSQTQGFAGGVGNLNATFGYNAGSQMISRSRDNDDYAFAEYVNVNRSYAVNGLNQYSSAGGATFGYDANGNLTSDGTNSYVYDAENRLVSTSSYGATLTYDPLGRLWQTASTKFGKTQFLYDGDQVAVEYDGDTGGIRRRYMFAGEDEPILVDEGSALDCSGTRFLHTDHLGSIIAQADCSGNRKTKNTYDEYGIPGGTNAGRFQYTGEAWIPELGMYYYKARFYSPTLGRFLQTDPVGYKDQVNLYAYVANDPVNGRDPTGTESEYSCAKLGRGCGPQNGQAGQPMIDDTVADPIGTGIGIGLTVLAPERLITKPLAWAARAFGIGRVAERAAGFASVAARDSHFAAHSGEFGFKTASAYEKAAENFMTGKAGHGVMEGTRTGGDVVRYNPKTNEFGVISKDGSIRTYFKPDPVQHGLKDNLEYFKRAIN